MTLSQRIPEFDGVRGILSVLVVSGHVYSAAIPWYPGAMDFFFCMSGFLITRILLGTPELSWDFLKIYAVRRALRIWPMYYVALLLYFIASATLLPAAQVRWHGIETAWAFSWPSVLLSSVFLQNIEVMFGLPRVESPSLFAHSWSVAVEEQFYFLWPLMLLSRRLWSRQFAWILVGLAAVVAVAVRAVGYVEYDADAVGMCVLPSRLDSFAAGITLAFMLRSEKDAEEKARLRRSFLLLSVLAALMLAPSLAIGYGVERGIWSPVLLRTIFDQPLGFSLLAFSTLGLIILSTGSSLLAPLRHSILMHLGEISYSTYLLHILALVAVSLFMEQYGLSGIFIQWSLSLALAIGVAHLTYRYVEAPALALKPKVPG